MTSMTSMERATPISRVVAKPRIVPDPYHSRTKPAIMVVTLASMIARSARL